MLPTAVVGMVMAGPVPELANRSFSSSKLNSQTPGGGGEGGGGSKGGGDGGGGNGDGDGGGDGGGGNGGGDGGGDGGGGDGGGGNGGGGDGGGEGGGDGGGGEGGPDDRMYRSDCSSVPSQPVGSLLDCGRQIPVELDGMPGASGGDGAEGAKVYVYRSVVGSVALLHVSPAATQKHLLLREFVYMMFSHSSDATTAAWQSATV